MRTSLLIIVAVFALSTPSYAQNFWQSYHGPFGWSTPFVATTPSGSIFANSDSLYRSTDSGSTWSGYPLGGLNQILTAPNGHLFANNGYIFRSTNNGDTWATTGLNNTANIAIDAEGRLFAAYGDVEWSTDDGASWTFATNFTINSITIVGVDDRDSVLAVDNDGFFYVSHDHGVNFRQILGVSVGTSLMVMKSGGGVFVGATNGTIDYSPNYGYSWSVSMASGSQGAIRSLMVSANGDVFAATSNSGMFRSTDDGTTWIAAGNGLPVSATSPIMMLSRGPNNTILMGLNPGLWQSADNGNTWYQIGCKLASNVSSFAFTSGGHILAASDYGLGDWDPSISFWSIVGRGLPPATPARNVFVSSNNFLFASFSDNTIYRSMNNGLSWDSVYNNSQGIFNITGDNSGRILIGAGGIYSAWGGEILRSSDNGSSWSVLTTSSGHYIESDHGGKLFSLDAQAMYRSTDDGGTWSQILSLSLGSIGPAGFAIGKNNFMYLADQTSGGVRRSTDGGTTWTVSSSGLPGQPNSVMVDVQGSIYAFYGIVGAYRSTDFGATWNPLATSGLPGNQKFLSMACDSSGYLYAGGNGYGVVRSALPSSLGLSELSVTVNDRWNIVSVPLTVSNYAKSTLYPTAVSNAFAYQGGYVTAATLANGVGYWLKFNGAQAVPETGSVRPLDSIAVQAGWNLIGSISSPVAVEGLGSSPGGIVASQFFGYDARYYTTDSIRPGKGYWVKVNQGGKLILAASSVLSPATRITIVPNEEMPPPPPQAEVSNLIPKIPDQFGLNQNYPNPFNPTTVVSYQLPLTSYVTLKVYNMLGQEMTTLVNGMQDAGYKSVTWNAANVPSGIYFYRLQAGTFTETKKLLLLR